MIDVGRLYRVSRDYTYHLSPRLDQLALDANYQDPIVTMCGEIGRIYGFLFPPSLALNKEYQMCTWCLVELAQRRLT